LTKNIGVKAVVIAESLTRACEENRIVQSNFCGIEMARGWTPERRAKMRAAIHRWRPWEKSTGPKTEVGKAKVAGNAFKHGHRSAAAQAESKAIRKMLAELGC